jgi:HAD superfamily phosphoserine phosphatase-like hydrolase
VSAQIAAFFDLDGTLVPLPSLERRFFRVLRQRREIPLKNYFHWLREALKLLPLGISTIAHANKMYLRGVETFDENCMENRAGSLVHKGGRPSRIRADQAEGQASTPPRRNARLPVPRFFEDGIERVVCHAMLGHDIVIVSGTLEPLARAAARALEAELAARGFATKIRVCATKLEESQGRWTGRILGEAMFGKAKARAVKKVAEEMGLDLSQSWAYGDSAADRWMLQAVGHPTAVNPTLRLARVARKRDWPVLLWREERNRTQGQDEGQKEETKHAEEPAHETVLQRAERPA